MLERIQLRDESFPSPSESAAGRSDAARTLGELMLCAEEYERGTGPSTDSEKWFREESESLLRWAHQSGRFLPAVELGGLILGFKELEGGLEHQVFWRKSKGRLIKITKPPYFGANWTLASYVQNVIWCNAFYDDDIRLEGVVSTSDGVSLVISQPFIVGRKPTVEQVEEWFTMQGCTRMALNRWKYPSGLVVEDTHTGNLILRKDGTLFPIDLRIAKLGDVQIPNAAQIAKFGVYGTISNQASQSV